MHCAVLQRMFRRANCGAYDGPGLIRGLSPPAVADPGARLIRV